ncbi:MAG: tyrosine-type recombinase/integrase [Nanoarchaeota archaeon]|nr:tyrosine-type recombinase/integrase [Nanoarchaeota archaeon]
MSYTPLDVNKAVRKECERRGYSERTIKTYQMCIKKFLNSCGKELGVVGRKDVIEFLQSLKEKGASGSTLNVYHMAVRFLIEDILDKRIKLNIKYSRRPEKLPRVLTKEEIRKLIGKICNWKHRLMIELMYGAGLRVSEVINLRVKDLKIDKNFGFVRSGKGNKDRMFILPRIVSEKIKNLIEIEKLAENDFLFLTNKREQYSARSLQEIVRKASKEAGLSGVHCHTLRHSFATHLIEQGQTVSEVQSLLGHKSPETTFIYLHTATPNMIKIKSPLDS